MAPGGFKEAVSHKFFSLTEEAAVVVGAWFKAIFPEDYERYRRAFVAGQWFAQDPGPFLGRAVVFKLQVGDHRDAADGGPSATFGAGHFTGGEMNFTDLETLLE